MIRLTFLLPLLSLIACTGPDDDGADSGTGDSGTGDSGDSGTGDSGDSGTGDSGTGDSGDSGTGDSGDSGDSGMGAIAVAGDWIDNWGGEHTVTDDAWLSGGSTYAITGYDNDAGWAVAQNGDENAWNPGLWSRFDWGWSDGELLFCQTAYAAATEADALATPAADLASPASGCGGFSWTALRAPLALDGTWDDSWGGQHTIDPFLWASGSSSYAIAQAEDEAGWIVAQNGSANAWNPDLWSRFDWAWDADGELRFCQTAYAAATEADALATPAADADDMAAGCGGFSWSGLRAALSIDGAWNDNWGGSHTIDAFTWASGSSTYAITQADDAGHWLVAQNGAGNAWSPGLWSRFDWTWDGEGQLWFCQIAYAAETEADALATPAADPSDPATTGCGGFSWSSLTPAGS